MSGHSRRGNEGVVRLNMPRKYCIIKTIVGVRRPILKISYNIQSRSGLNIEVISEAEGHSPPEATWLQRVSGVL